MTWVPTLDRKNASLGRHSSDFREGEAGQIFRRFGRGHLADKGIGSAARKGLHLKALHRSRIG
jgi:hypothetical protein